MKEEAAAYKVVYRMLESSRDREKELSLRDPLAGLKQLCAEKRKLGQIRYTIREEKVGCPQTRKEKSKITTHREGGPCR